MKDVTVPAISTAEPPFIRADEVKGLKWQFNGIPELHGFFVEEEKKWDFYTYPAMLQARSNCFRPIIDRLQKLVSEWADLSSHEVKDLALKIMLETFENQNWPWSWLSPGRQILELRDKGGENQTVAVYALAEYIGVETIKRDAAAFNEVSFYASALFFLQEHGKLRVVNEANAEATVLENRVTDQLYRSERTEGQLRDFLDRLGQLSGEVESRSVSTVHLFDDLIRGGTSDLANLKSRYEATIKTSSIERDLQAKAKGHAKMFWAFLLVSLAVAVVSIWAIIGHFIPDAAQKIADDETNRASLIMKAADPATKSAIAESSGHVAWFSYLEIAMLLTVALYVIRLLVRLAMSQFHQWQDSDERLVLLRTYYTILEIIANKGDKFSDAERAIVINSIYRPSTVGVIKDEHGTSLNLSEIIAKALENPSRTG